MRVFVTAELLLGQDPFTETATSSDIEKVQNLAAEVLRAALLNVATTYGNGPIDEAGTKLLAQRVLHSVAPPSDPTQAFAKLVQLAGINAAIEVAGSTLAGVLVLPISKTPSHEPLRPVALGVPGVEPEALHLRQTDVVVRYAQRSVEQLSRLVVKLHQDLRAAAQQAHRLEVPSDGPRQ